MRLHISDCYPLWTNLNFLRTFFKYILPMKLIGRMIDDDRNNKNFIHLYLAENEMGNQFYRSNHFPRSFIVVIEENLKYEKLNKVSKISHYGIEKQLLTELYCIFIYENTFRQFFVKEAIQFSISHFLSFLRLRVVVWCA